MEFQDSLKEKPKTVKSRFRKFLGMSAIMCNDPIIIIPNNEGEKEVMYTLEKPIGSGGFAEVFMGKNHKGKKFAIKRMPKNACREELRRREIEAGKRLRNHERIAHFYDSFDDEEYQYLVFELVKGTDLFGVLENNKFKPVREKKVKKMFRQLVEAVHFCHKNSVVHRDIKLENVLVSKTGNIKLIDFGLCDLVDDGKMCNEFLGTKDYVPPEEMAPDATLYCGESADVWAMGTILYMLLVAEVPFDPTHREMYKAGNLDEHPQFEWLPNHGENISLEGKDLIERMLQVNPKHRISMQSLLKHPWFSLKETKSIWRRSTNFLGTPSKSRPGIFRLFSK